VEDQSQIDKKKVSHYRGFGEKKGRPGNQGGGDFARSQQGGWDCGGGRGVEKREDETNSATEN